MTRLLKGGVRGSPLGFLMTSAVTAGVLHRVAAQDTNDLAPLLPPRPELPPGLWEQFGIWIVLGAVFVVAVAAGCLWWFTRPKLTPKPFPAAQAREQLAALRQQPEEGLVLSRVSQILRQYFGTLFGLPPGERTTAEFTRVIRGDPTLSPELEGALVQFLEECDRRKFAPVTPEAPLGAVQRAWALIDQAQAQRASTSATAANRPVAAARNPR